MRRCRASLRLPTLLACLVVGSIAHAESAGAGIIGFCPDGSMFIVPRAELIPCRDAKLVEPDEVPPLRAQFLPRPYAWEVHQRRNDPNNP